MNTLAFWLPLFLLFLSALVGALIKRRSCDHCLKRFNGNQVLLPIGTKDWICGKLEVFAQGLEISSMKKNQIPCGFVHSRIIPSKEVSTIQLVQNDDQNHDGFMTETLARIYVEQKNYIKAIQSYKILSLKYPEKNSFFASQIKVVQKLIKENL